MNLLFWHSKRIKKYLWLYIGMCNSQFGWIVNFGYKFIIDTSQFSCSINKRNTWSALMENLQRYHIRFIRKYQNPGGYEHQLQLRNYWSDLSGDFETDCQESGIHILIFCGFSLRLYLWQSMGHNYISCKSLITTWMVAKMDFVDCVPDRICNDRNCKNGLLLWSLSDYFAADWYIPSWISEILAPDQGQSRYCRGYK